MARGVKKGSKRGKYASKNKSFEENFKITFERIQARVRKKMPNYRFNVQPLSYSDIVVGYTTLENSFPEFQEMNSVDKAKFMADQLLSNWSEEQVELISDYAEEHDLDLPIPKNLLKYVDLSQIEIYDSINNIMYDDIVSTAGDSEDIYRRDKDGNFLYDEQGRRKLNSYLIKDWFSDNIFGSK